MTQLILFHQQTVPFSSRNSLNIYTQTPHILTNTQRAKPAKSPKHDTQHPHTTTLELKSHVHTSPPSPSTLVAGAKAKFIGFEPAETRGSVPRRFCVPVQRAGAAPAEGRPSNSRGGTMTWRGGAESRPRGDQHSIQIVPIIHGERSDSR